MKSGDALSDFGPVKLSGERSHVQNKCCPVARCGAHKKKPPAVPGAHLRTCARCQGTFELCTEIGLNGRDSLPANSPMLVSVGQAPGTVQKPLPASG